MALQEGGGKLSGKTQGAATRRRSVTRRSGFSVKSGNTGGTYRVEATSSSFQIGPETPFKITFKFSQTEGLFAGFGFWFAVDIDDPSKVSIELSNENELEVKLLKKVFPTDDWSKVGSMWKADSSQMLNFGIKIKSAEKANLYVYQPLCGTVSEPQLDAAPHALTKNMHAFAPEALFVSEPGIAEYSGREIDAEKVIYLKNCNRCARYLPVNTGNERNHLSFSNHCTAHHKVPCQDSTFSKLRKVEDSEPSLILRHGFQLECRFCKKFYVNAAHNPQRTAEQMREDGHRRRAFEKLIEEVTGGSPQILYRHHNAGHELIDDVLERFRYRCFSCNTELDKGSVNLDHTRPLALLWPLDGTATALCKDCNTDKRDRTPRDFYSSSQLKNLAKILDLDLTELQTAGTNIEVLDTLWDRREWIFANFFESESIKKIRQGKDTRKLIIKALDKAAANSAERDYSFSEAYSDFLKKRN